ncbi:MAG: MBL fold metallo-hydrolase [Thermodesulfobacteriota bacterium]
MKVTILGCATSTGVPIAGCMCPVCTSKDPKNVRTRSSIFIKKNNVNILIDSSTDLRFQSLTNNITRIDAVLYTHSHADHTHGIDDLRSFNFINRMEIYCYGNKLTVNNIKSNFKYVFDDFPAAGGKPRLNFKIVDKKFQFRGVDITPIEINHANWLILGYRIGNMAYLTDCSGIPDKSVKKLKNLDLLIIGALRYRPHVAHFSVEQAVEMINKIKPKKAVLTHMGHELDFNLLNSELPKNITPGFDGQKFVLKD